jgi:hypothetical protein
VEHHFKGWAKPGPIPPGALSPPDVPPDETLDAISGHFRIFQLRDGHRFSTDDVLTAWYGTTWAPRASSILDLGSGIGSVATIAAWRLPSARVVTIEAQDDNERTWEEPQLVIRAADGRVHPEYSAVKLSIGFPP